ncbi:MAG: anthranilate phosphoribosyltransferase [Rudaea sp.]|nr:anthranilate phosphoribosyltransferase [Rudaea sp.]
MPMTPQEALQRTIEHREIFQDEMVDLMRQIMRGEVSPLMVAAILTGLRVKKETVGEIAAAASVMREMCAKIPHAGVPAAEKNSHLVDIVGTGGDSSGTFNISTASMFAAAAAGARVAKHGNRSVSSKSGSADVLEALGVVIDLTPEQVAVCLDETGIGFMFAPIHHPAMKAVAPVRKEMGVRTLFNILGPLTNPAGAPNILMGVFHADLVGIQVRALQRLGAQRALVVWGRDGLDEITLGDSTLVGELRGDDVREYEIHPRDFGLASSPSEALRVSNPAQSRERVLEALDDKPGPVRDIVLLNAGAALYVAGLADSIAIGIEQARAVVASGAARTKLDRFVAATRRIGGR